ncbi:MULTISPECIES: helix-turn-helix domain-containing protein [Lactiplantibacillus]|uniref:Ornithine utilization regulator n=6 Tax=Lactiplantibacillus plantarum TaxID=1590 RepID=A0A2S3U9N3_LACPN|nr:AraC family transcriptional regulator [Lactiplantibacillus plantarum]MBG1239416.1 helix-turn-helix transcriptional regulator [Lactiplantibacillus plantarum subsp. plantarum]AGL64024.2 Transcription regulator [Lactiplantibacillus plantarum subsp. plantarum P-8]AGO07969.1 AraC family transcriptional regulator [Lactiplantibacillus plantarum 16]AMO29545.1 AraC family transcriptional regulator [Lactiplantibacillus plantarum]ANJ13411.1 AraC family transcriptional regulator [Lactiplantibacillus pl
MKIMVSEQFQCFMASLGVDLNSLLEAAGINKVVWQEQLMLSDVEYWQLMNEFDNQLTDEMILSLGNITNINTFMPSFFAALAAKNGEQAIARMANYKSLAGPVHLEIVTKPDIVNIHILGNSLGVELPRFTIMTEQLLLISLLRVGTGKLIKPISVGSKYPYGDQIDAVMGIRPQQLADNCIQFQVTDLQRAFISANNSMWAFLQPGLDQQKLAIEHNQSLLATVQALLLKKIPSGSFSIDEIATSLNLSKRTLQRHLSTLSTTFNDEVQIARRTLVVPLMKDQSLNLIEISYLLGYSDPESFSRAFKKWFHQSPSVYRQQSLGMFKN